MPRPFYLFIHELESRLMEAMELGRLLIGTLVVNVCDYIERVNSIELSGIRVGYNAGILPILDATINGKPHGFYRGLPVTMGLLKGLGWRLERPLYQNVVYAFPESAHLRQKNGKRDFKIAFIFKQHAIKDQCKAATLIQDMAGNWVQLTDYSELENYFLAFYHYRLRTDFRRGMEEIHHRPIRLEDIDIMINRETKD